MNKYLTILLLQLSVFSSSAEHLRIVFAGDIMGHSPQISAAKTDSGYDYNPCYTYIKPYIDSADFAVANFEITLAGEPYTGYPQFSSPDEALAAPVNAGFDFFLLANNHIADRSTSGLKKTVQKMQSKTLFAGAYIDSIQRDSIYPAIVKINVVKTSHTLSLHDSEQIYGCTSLFKIALLNYTYGTNGIVLPKPSIINYIDTIQIKIDIQKIKNQYDMLICCVHWGTEYQNHSNKEQEKLAQFLTDNGVDLIIGSHPHVVQNFDVLYRNGDTNLPVPVYYSLGNMISNQRDRYKNGGILAVVDINPKSKKITNCDYLPFYVHKGLLFNKYHYYLLPTTDFSDNQQFYNLKEDEYTALELFDSDTKSTLKNLPMQF
ncbi:MAG: CapA family protein [Bacteroidales bacterium]|jgi:poly-gamma-glutamate synthesis protein (capsule biosynthesis protein)|nr:CapA family protein [Bacteroidales bacterium]